MTKKIFRSLLLVALAVFLAAVVLIMGVLYGYFSRIQQTQLAMQTQLAAQGVQTGGLAYLEGLTVRDYRITWISPRGEVLYDSRADSDRMENHLQRQEVRQALETGFGESRRLSATLTERSLYAAQRLEDGSVVRLAIAQSSIFTMLLGVGQGFAVVLLIALALSLWLAHRLSRRVVEPLNGLDLDEPLQNEGYEELAPLLRRIDGQQRQLREQAAQLERRQQELDAVTGSMQEGMMLLNAQGDLLSVNPAARTLLGAEECAPGQDALALNRSEPMRRALEKVLAGQRAEELLSLRGGRYLLTASPIFSGDTLTGAAVLLLDVTEKEQAEALRREFTANVSHELKTPLHAISGYAELLQNGLARPEDVQPFAGKIYAEAQRMVRLVEDIISLSHLDEGAGDMTWETLDLYDAARVVLAELADGAEAAGVTAALAGSSAPIRAVPQLVRSILFNLIDNAVKYNCPGGRVDVRVERSDDGALLTVADTGVGIPAGEQERIFQRFYRVDKSRSKEVGGTGLGLSIVKHAALILGARLQLDSAPGRGTAVTVRFPAGQ